MYLSKSLVLLMPVLVAVSAVVNEPGESFSIVSLKMRI